MRVAERRKRDLAILMRYHGKVNVATYVRRKRGNPPNLIKAAARLKGGKQCCECGSLDRPHLHHINENWRDYRPENLQFLCQPCHMKAHRTNTIKETSMTIRNVRKTWTHAQLQELRQDVNQIVQNHGVSKTAAFKQLTSKYGLSPVTIENYYYDKAGRYTNRQAASPRTSGVTLREVVRMIQILRAEGIPVEI